MFVRPNWKPRKTEELFTLMDSYPWALLVNNGSNGPLATNLPLLLDRSRGEHGVLVSHIARGNEHAKALESLTTPSLAIFEGPYSYVTASWYPKRDMPSTYYYTSVHCYGRIRLQNDEELEHWLEKLVVRMESQYPNGWKVTDIERKDILRRIPYILGFELEIERIEGKFKLGQDEPKKDAMAVYQHLAASTDPSHRALAEMVRDYNSGRPENE